MSLNESNIAITDALLTTAKANGRSKRAKERREK